MTDKDGLLAKRFIELAEKSYGSGIYVFTDFLGLAEQSVLESVKREISHVGRTEFGGAVGAERVMVRFGSEEELGYDLPFPISIIFVKPASPKFSEKLTHRDYLGTVLGLGIERRCVGDIILREGVGYIFVKEDIAEFVCENLVRIRNTEVRASITDALPEGELYRTEPRRIQANGERVDAVIAKVFSLSREESSRLFTKGLVFVSGREMTNTSYIPKAGEVISVRGYGRMIYRGCESLSRKGKMNILVELYV